MMAGNPNWWNMMINSMHSPASAAAAAAPASQFMYGGCVGPNLSSFLPSNSGPDHHPSQIFPFRSWSQLLLGGLSGGSSGESLLHQKMQMEDWEDDDDEVRIHGHHPHQALNLNPPNSHFSNSYDRSNSSGYNNNSCTTSLSNNFLNFSTAPAPPMGKRHHHHHTQHHSYECNSSSSGGASKKARVHQCSAQPALKVRKEKLGDRITSLHQLVSPFGKTDTASVLSETIGYIRFLHGQIQALSSPYMRSSAGSGTVQHLHSVSEGPEAKNLRSRGLCLVSVSCTQNVVGSDCGGADYWAPAPYGGASTF